MQDLYHHPYGVEKLKLYPKGQSRGVQGPDGLPCLPVTCGSDKGKTPPPEQKQTETLKP